MRDKVVIYPDMTMSFSFKELELFTSTANLEVMFWGTIVDNDN